MAFAPARGRWTVVAALMAGYIGVYLCRKNLSVAVPLLQADLHLGKQEVGWVASVGTLAYAAGKLVLGPVIDRIGGRAGFLAVLVAVAALGALGALAPGVALLTVVYSANRFAGAGGWPSMMKLVPTWFEPQQIGRATAILSVSYVAGGALATVFAGQVASMTANSWRAVMGVPSLVLAVITVACVLFVRTGPLAPPARKPGEKSPILDLLVRPQFLVVCALSLTLSLVRETFGTWSVDFLTSLQSGEKSVAAAALGSTAFDLAGVASILAMGFAWDLTRPGARRWLLSGILAVLAVVLFVLPNVPPAGAAPLLGVVGLLAYGPYSLLAGALAVDAGGARGAATASGIIDFVGYLAGSLSGAALGHLLDVGGYSLGFRCLAAVAAASAVIALAFREKR